MNTLESGFLILEIKSIAAGYQVLQIVSRRDDLRILEASVAGDRFVILAIGKSDVLEARMREAREHLDASGLLIDHELASLCPAEVVEAFYNLPQVEALEAVVVVETVTVSSLLAVAQTLVQGYGLKIIEAKIRRTGGGAYGFFTGTSQQSAPAAEEARTRLARAMRDGRIELIDHLSRTFRSQFNLSGNLSGDLTGNLSGIDG